MSRQLLTCFEDFQKVRISFVQNIATFAERPQNIEALKEEEVRGNESIIILAL
jgi:hypothetical protein